jgi:hypothetical protein
MAKAEQKFFSMYQSIERILENFKSSVEIKHLLYGNAINFRKILEDQGKGQHL